MGTKGTKLTENATVASEGLEASLSELGIISRRKMFGGYGVFESGPRYPQR
jgi:TfoX/Sxy family transcriptional regulator of competence genes